MDDDATIPDWRRTDAPIRIGVSSCLLGNEVRFDGGHKRDAFLTQELAPFVEWVPVCPEVEVGMGIPRPTVRLVRLASGVRMIAERSGHDYTDAMETWSEKRLRTLRRLELGGFVLKKDSPSCGMERVRIYDRGMPTRIGRGLFADRLLAELPSLPIEEEGRLNDPLLRENFVERLFAYRRVRQLFAGRWRPRDLIEFHTAHKLQLLAHSPTAYRELGRLVARVKELPRGELGPTYETAFMAALTRRATRKRHVNVLQHMAGYFRNLADAADRAELARLIDDYGAGLVPLIVPITLIQHHVRRSGVSYLADQIYLAPHPKELMLRNHV